MKNAVLFCSTVLIVLLAGPAVSADDSTKTTDDSTKTVADDSTKTVEATTTKATETKSLSLVTWEKLTTFLPGKIEGMITSDPTGRDFSIPNPSGKGSALTSSVAEGTYQAKERDGIKLIKIRFMDTGNNTLLLGSMASKEEFEDETGSLKHVDFKGNPGILGLDKKGDLNTRILASAVIGNRILAAVEGNEYCTVEEIVKLAEALDFEGIKKALK